MSLPRLHLLIVLLAMFASAVHGQSNHKNPPTPIYRDKVEPHWFAGESGETNQFWYRVELRDNGRQFVLVNARAGTRSAAFDHARVAAELSKQATNHFDAEHLPVETIQFTNGGQMILLQGLDASWKLDLPSYKLTPESADDSAGNRLSARRVPHPSRFTGPATKIKFVNRLKGAVSLFWIDDNGNRQPYGTLKAGDSRSQNTYAGHVWLITAADGKVLAVFQAEAKAGLAIIDGKSEFRSRQREGGNAEETTASPDGHWEAVVRGTISSCVI